MQSQRKFLKPLPSAAHQVADRESGQSLTPAHIRKRYRQPLSISYVDFPGSKGTMSAREASELLKFGLLHVHAVVALRPEGQALRRSLVQHISFVVSVK